MMGESIDTTQDTLFCPFFVFGPYVREFQRFASPSDIFYKEYKIIFSAFVDTWYKIAERHWE